jgi:ubiquinone/menaquinone biosynthesis C-methylase UbiE
LLDAQAPMLAMASERLKKRGLVNYTAACGGAESLPFADAAFDVVFMITVLGEVPDRASAVRETVRVLRPGGCFSATEAAGDPDRVNGRELDDLAARAGLAKGESWSGLLVKTFNYHTAAGDLVRQSFLISPSHRQGSMKSGCIWATHSRKSRS